MKDISRRDFLRGTAAGALSIAAAGVLGACQTEASAETTAGTQAATQAVTQAATTAAAEPTEASVQAETPTASSWDMEYDVVVVGLGGAGASAAIEAHDAGARVLILEKQPEATHYSNTRLSGGYFHAPDPAGDHAALIEYCKAMMSGENCPWKLEGEQPHVSQEIAEMYADGVLEIKDFLMAQGPDLDETVMEPGGESSFPMFPGFEKALYGSSKVVRYVDYAEADGSLMPQERPRLTKTAGEAFHWALVEDGIKTQRPGIDILYESPAKELLVEDGQIAGVLALVGGQETRICANRGVVLASGGYEYNLPMRRAFLEGPGVKGWVFYGTPENTGDGIEMAMKVGAGLAKVGKAASRIEIGVPYGEHWENEGLKMGIASSITSAKNSMIVDNYGKRYADEFIITDSGRPYRYQFYKEALQYELLSMSYPRVPSWLIFDETRRTESCAVATSYSVAAFGLVPWAKDNSDAIERGWILKADTIEELAQLIQADEENRDLITPEQLKESIENFNRCCEKGEDTDFGRSPDTMAPLITPPFYALKLYPGGPNTKGGIDANAKRQVLDWAGNPVPRLYTAGEISSIFKFTYQAGGNLTECIVCGRQAGKQVAAETSWTGHDAPKSDKADVKLEKTKGEDEEDIPEVALSECKDGTYTETTTGMNGSFDVTVTIADHKITDIQIGENSETVGYGAKAIEELPGLLIETQDVNIDGTSGATVTSNAILRAVKKCLVQASK
ncbi:MAG: FAD-dependent oxidoreductase [Lachnospiraceae bacterium]|nr:FAD-dependent oxidoreductase [Lachnospiraceae bacterium]